MRTKFIDYLIKQSRNKENGMDANSHRFLTLPGVRVKNTKKKRYF